MPVFGTCAGMILLADKILDGRDDQRHFGVLDITVRRNGYGRQVDSFETDLDLGDVDDRSTASSSGAPRRGRRARRRGPRALRRRPGARAPGATARRLLPPRAHRRRTTPRPVRGPHQRKRDKPCPATPNGQPSSTRRAPPTRRAASCSPSSPASSRSRPGRAAATPTPTRRCAPPCRRPRRRR